ncbi:MAG: hypothetical protein K0M55_09240 [Rhizobium sp.]|nr:hypothetical protein [Rhizobium sp.]MBW8319763.1 hypothetical protein [Rhizobium sp.]
MNLASTFTEKAQTEGEDTNDVLIRNYTSVGSMQGMGKIEVEAREIVVPDRRHVAYFVKVSAESMDDFPQTSVALLQYDNLPKLIASIDKLAGSNIKTDRFAFSEVEYEVDGVKIIVFNDARGKILFVICIGSVSVHFNGLNRLPEFKELILRAKRHLDQHRIEF